jgi:hypothetical protein
MLDANAVIDDFLQSHDLDYDQKDESPCQDRPSSRPIAH